MLATSCPPSTLTGPEGGARTLHSAGNAAEAAYHMQREGKPRRCCRGAGLVTAEQCLAMFRAGNAPCVTEQHGRCTTGIIEDTKYPEDTMGSVYGHCANPECPSAGKRMSLPARGLCGTCYRKMRAGELTWPPKKVVQDQPQLAGAPVEAQECRPSEDVQEQPEAIIFGREGTPAVATKQGDGAAVFGQAEPFEKIEELPDQDHFSQAGNMAPDLPEDLDRPFSLAGFDFEPAGPVRPVGKRSVSIRQDTVCFLAGTVQEHDLGRYTHARMTASKDGRAIAVKFYSAARDGANQLQNTDKAYRTLAAKTFLQGHPKFQGEKTVLEWMGVEGWFLMRVSGEKGEAA